MYTNYEQTPAIIMSTSYSFDSDQGSKPQFIHDLNKWYLLWGHQKVALNDTDVAICDHLLEAGFMPTVGKWAHRAYTNADNCTKYAVQGTIVPEPWFAAENYGYW